jgi:hypothetical protein
MPPASIAAFDTLTVSQKLQEVGFTREQSEGLARIQSEIVESRLVTRDYLDQRLTELEYKLTVRMGGMLAAAIAIITALNKLL